MKVRTDFVTNSSSSSFMLALKDELTEKQKAAIIECIADNAFGSPVTEDDWEEMPEYFRRSRIQRARDLQENGWTIRTGEVSFAYRNVLADFIRDLWRAVAQADPEHLDVIFCSQGY